MKTRLTQRLGLAYPIIQAPMAGAGYVLAVRPDGGAKWQIRFGITWLIPR